MVKGFCAFFLKRNIFFWVTIIISLSSCGKFHNKAAKNVAVGSYKLSMPAVFCDHMVLQRNKPLSFWGDSKPGSKIMVYLDNQTKSVLAGKDGHWELKFPAMKAGGPYELKVVDQEGNTLAFKDVLLGDVWLCAGQSNLNFMLAADRHGSAEMASLSNTNIREYRCKMPDGVKNPENKDHSKWIPAVGRKAARFSAVAYYFAKKVQEAAHVPLGILVMSCGDTRAESWMAEKAIKNDPALDPLAQYWKRHKTDSTIPFNHRPAEFYNTVVKPVIPYAVKGVVWYQGESNTLPDNSGRTIAERASEYKDLLSDLIENWRTDRNDPSLPFYIVQLPNYKDPSGDIQWAQIRQAQLEVMKSKKHTGLAITIDLGDSTKLHPTNKQPVGERLAYWAIGKDYNKSEKVISGPIIKNIHVKRDKATLRFDYVDGGLVNKANAQLTGFEIAGVLAPHNFVTANAHIDGDKVIVSNSSIKNPVAVRYGWADNPKVSLYNKLGLPASPFEISLK